MDDIITLDYGSGGRKTSQLIDEVLLPAFSNAALSELGDAAILPGGDRLVFSTDSFVVSPCFFPGGDIGKLSVCGTVNDIAVCGGVARYLSFGLIMEEGFPLADLKRIVRSAAGTAADCGVSVVTGDTKVVERGRCDGVYINTAGVGFLRYAGLGVSAVRPGDRVLVSGTLGDHGAAVMLARNGLSGDIVSDCRPLHRLAAAAAEAGGVRVMRDPTRGGAATTLCEFAEGSPFGIELDEALIPVSEAVSGACGMLGLDPLYCANEGKLLAIVSPDSADAVLAAMRSLPEGADAAVIGAVTGAHPGLVTLSTPIGGTRILQKLAGAQLPRIC